MLSHAGILPANASWFHEEKITNKEGEIRMRESQQVLELKGRGGHVHLDKENHCLHSRCDGGFWIDRVLRYFDMSSRIKRGQLATHASAIQKNNKTWLLAGYSGAGKSTAADLAITAGYLKLQDDLVFLQGGNYIDSVDWSNMSRPKTGSDFKVNGILLLEQATDHRLIPIGYKEALTRVGPIWGFPKMQDPSSWLASLDNELRKIPVYRLRFRKDAGFTSLLEAC